MPPPYQELFSQLAASSGNNSVAMPLEVWRSAFINDAPEDVQRVTHSLMVPQPFQYFTETVPPRDAGALGVRPATCSAARTSPCRRGSTGGTVRRPARVAPVVAPGSHEALLTQPAGLAATFLKV